MQYVTASASRLRDAYLRRNPNFRWDSELYFWIVVAALVTPIILCLD